jgi:hypothetical protein
MQSCPVRRHGEQNVPKTWVTVWSRRDCRRTVRFFLPGPYNPDHTPKPTSQMPPSTSVSSAAAHRQPRGHHAAPTPGFRGRHPPDIGLRGAEQLCPGGKPPLSRAAPAIRNRSRAVYTSCQRLYRIGGDGSWPLRFSETGLRSKTGYCSSRSANRSPGRSAREHDRRARPINRNKLAADRDQDRNGSPAAGAHAPASATRPAFPASQPRRRETRAHQRPHSQAASIAAAIAARAISFCSFIASLLMAILHPARALSGRRGGPLRPRRGQPGSPRPGSQGRKTGSFEKARLPGAPIPLPSPAQRLNASGRHRRAVTSLERSSRRLAARPGSKAEDRSRRIGGDGGLRGRQAGVTARAFRDAHGLAQNFIQLPGHWRRLRKFALRLQACRNRRRPLRGLPEPDSLVGGAPGGSFQGARFMRASRRAKRGSCRRGSNSGSTRMLAT